MKIYHDGEWITVDQTDERVRENNIVIEHGALIGQGALIEQDAVIEHGARIGQGAVIEQGARIEHGARIGQDALIGRGALIEQDARIDVMCIYSCGKFPITACNGMIAVGCELHTPEDWYLCADEIAEKNHISEADRLWYKQKLGQVYTMMSGGTQ